ncbi:uncharacterized protein LOC111323760 [Stylophora pistillata]|nr:uncharacterized protein LOC111323760 [Stylophora pistillata]XP_022782923.1 uncharacterized protein LOC111323760 [Stylophora pistillata]
MTGVAVCSVLTATLSSALTNVTEERYDVTTTKTIGAQKESFAFKQAVKLGANVVDFENLQEAFFSLENGNVEGILEEMFTGIEFIKQKRNAGLSIVKVLERQHYYGAGIKRDGFSANVLDCLPKVINSVSEDIYSNTSRLLKSVKHFDKSSSQMSETSTDSAQQNYSGLIDQDSVSFKATVIGISVTLFLFITCSSGFVGFKHLRRKISKEPIDLEAGVK